jgi:hypothetical protein
MISIVDSIRAEYLRYKALAEAAIDQLSDAELSAEGPNGGNSIAVICWHLSGNFRSRFTEFLTADGEKSWRQREEEFQPRTVSKAVLLAKWSEGWEVLLDALSALTDDQLHRPLAHASYHVGQIVYIAKSLSGDNWRYLSIPPGKSDAYNQAPENDRAGSHAAMLSKPATRA